MLAVRENLMKQFGVSVDETVLDRVIRFGTADISGRYLAAIRETAQNIPQGSSAGCGSMSMTRS